MIAKKNNCDEKEQDGSRQIKQEKSNRAIGAFFFVADPYFLSRERINGNEVLRQIDVVLHHTFPPGTSVTFFTSRARRDCC